ncbi:MAG TPA: SMI1/KNR4 family protein [Saprospiraceae bacterium]|nr:SMI1/KNR4 family protein [Saprospiraceae bacterium]
MEHLKTFFNRFNDNSKISPSKPFTLKEFDSLEERFKIEFPKSFKYFALTYGNIWTPNILDLIDEKEIEISDVQEFWNAEKIIFVKENEWTSKIEENLIPFASDCMGNIFCFAVKDLISRKEDCNVYFYDHDFDTIENLSLNFDEWIEQFNKIND